MLCKCRPSFTGFFFKSMEVVIFVFKLCPSDVFVFTFCMSPDVHQVVFQVFLQRTIPVTALPVILQQFKVKHVRVS